MKRILFKALAIVLFLNISVTMNSQAPELFSFQAVIRDVGDNLVTDQTVGIQISILNGYPFGSIEYVETHAPMTNSNGLVSLEIGNGSVVSGDIANIDWYQGEYYLKTEIDPTGGSSYNITSVAPFLSVPFALYDGDWVVRTDTLDSNGKWVGIGTSDPAEILEVTGDARINDLTVGHGVGDFDSNVVLGDGSLSTNTIGTQNTAIGAGTLNYNTEQSSQTAVGAYALHEAGNGVPGWEGGFNTAVGAFSLYANTGGQFNSALGQSSLYTNSTGSGNTALGSNAMKDNLTGNDNTTVGSRSLWRNLTGSNNIAIGADALYENTGGNVNVAVGSSALKNNTLGERNIALGNSALYSNLTPSDNVAVGSQAMFSSASGSRNIAIGTQTLYSNDLGSDNVAIGHEAMYSNLTGNKNISVGVGALYTNGDGDNNSAVGYHALHLNQDGYDNTALGSDALTTNSSGWGNTGIGSDAMFMNTIGANNTAVGSDCLNGNTTGEGNTGLGFDALHDNWSGDFNTAAGGSALVFLQTGIGCTAVGYSANPSGGGGIGMDNTTGLGLAATCTNPNQTRIGNSSVTSIGGYASWTTLPSDARFKENVQENVVGLEFISLLRPVTYDVDIRKIENHLSANFGTNTEFEWTDKYAKDYMRFTGFIAQEVEEAAKSVGFDFSGVDAPGNANDLYGLRYAEFVVPLVKGVQELNDRTQLNDSDHLSRIEHLEDVMNQRGSRIESLEAEIEDIKRTLSRLNQSDIR